ncbi:IclR family transcriptional regulator [Ramlibacter sp.]|uniref:IclR family transcriptional regulator n=1 Tax=Ramlibacter sp. TaxID=1917967 RepID=UPI003D124F20
MAQGAAIATPAEAVAPPRPADAPRRPGAPRPAMVAPFARALSLLGGFTPQDRWLGNRDLAARTGLPPSTISRIAQSLVILGYLHYDPDERKYRLAAPVLALGYAAIANSDLQRAARGHMQELADLQRVHVNLSSRDRLELVVMETCSGAQAPLALNLHVGARVGIASSPMGWALLAALPELERYYLMENVERRLPREWPRVRRRLGKAIAEVYEQGYCTSIGEWDRDLGIVAAPVLVEGHAPFVMACVGSSVQITRARVERELGPRLLGAARAIQQVGTIS